MQAGSQVLMTATYQECNRILTAVTPLKRKSSSKPPGPAYASSLVDMPRVVEHGGELVEDVVEDAGLLAVGHRVAVRQLQPLAPGVGQAEKRASGHQNL